MMGESSEPPPQPLTTSDLPSTSQKILSPHANNPCRPARAEVPNFLPDRRQTISSLHPLDAPRPEILGNGHLADRRIAFAHIKFGDQVAVAPIGDAGGIEMHDPDAVEFVRPRDLAGNPVRIVERGLLLMASRGLVERLADPGGIVYCAGDFSETFLASLASPYLATLRERASWVVQTFASMDDREFSLAVSQVFERWIDQFQHAQRALTGDA